MTELESLRAENVRLRSVLEQAREALRRAEHTLRLLHPGSATLLYERIAEDFYRETRLMAPGKSAPLEMQYGEEQQREREEKWRPFVGEWRKRFFDAALSAIEALGEEGRSDG